MPATPHPVVGRALDVGRGPFAASFGGVLLDLDGTLIDSIAAVVRSWLRWCGEYDVDPVRLTGFHGVTGRRTSSPSCCRRGAGPRRSPGSGRSRWPTSRASSLLPGAADLLAALADGGVPTGHRHVRHDATSPRPASPRPG